MSRYRKIEVSMWADAKFRALSPLPPSGQSLWLYLLTGPHTGPIPGLFRIGPMALAEELGWPLEDFDKAFREVFGEGFREAFREGFAEGMAKADTKARVILLPKAIFHNLPQSPNVVRSWAEEWKLVPDCRLKNEAKQIIRDALETVGSSYVSVFDEITRENSQPKPSPKPSRKPSPKPSRKPSQKTMANQEQEQEQDIKEESPLPPSANSGVKTSASVGVIEPPQEAFVRVKSVYPKRDGGQNWQQAQRAWMARRKEGHSESELLAGAIAYAGYIARTGKTGTVYVKQAATFFGPDKHFLADWGPPAAGAESGSLTGRAVL